MDKNISSDRPYGGNDEGAGSNIGRDDRVAGPNGKDHQPAAAQFDLDATVKLTAEFANYDPAILDCASRVINLLAKVKRENALNYNMVAETSHPPPVVQSPAQLSQMENRNPSVVTLACNACQSPFPKGKLFCPTCGVFQGRAAPVAPTLPAGFASFKRQSPQDRYRDTRAQLRRFAARLTPSLAARKFILPGILVVLVVASLAGGYRKGQTHARLQAARRPQVSNQYVQPEAPSNTPASPPSTEQIPAALAQGLLLKKVAPEYPAEARRNHIQGPVVISAMISRKGDVQELTLVSGHPSLAPAALKAVEKWKFKPYLLQGEPVEVETQITVNFQLSGG